MSDAIKVALIMASIPAVFGIIQTILNNRQLRVLAKMQLDAVATRAAVEETKQAVVVLEQNTNSIKDALVKVTAESEYAKGRKDEKDNKSE